MNNTFDPYAPNQRIGYGNNILNQNGLPTGYHLNPGGQICNPNGLPTGYNVIGGTIYQANGLPTNVQIGPGGHLNPIRPGW